MILDSSAIVALFFRQPEWAAIVDALEYADAIGISAASLAECGMILSDKLGRDARGMLARLIDELDPEIVPIGHEHYIQAVGAWLQFGQGKHPANLSFADCMSYATARLATQSLLCGADGHARFAHTDLPLVPLVVQVSA